MSASLPLSLCSPPPPPPPPPPQFTDLSITSECLFSLLNGDDMYMTYKEMPQTSYSLWIFSKIYLYLFIALFIYVVLSVFIGLISDTYETLNVSILVLSLLGVCTYVNVLSTNTLYVCTSSNVSAHFIGF